MSTPLDPILAASGEDPTVKIVVGVIVALFWIGSQIFGALTTKKPDRSAPPPMRRPRPTELPRDVPRAPPVGRTGVPGRTNVPPMPPRSKRQAPPPRRSAPRPQAIPTPAPVARKPAFAEPKKVVAPPPAKVLPRQQFLAALLRPRNLKNAYILAEIVRPPVALREPGDGFIG